MDALAGYVEANPDTRVERAMRGEVELDHDKVFIARSYRYANITSLTPQLEAQAKKNGKDPQEIDFRCIRACNCRRRGLG